MGNFRVLDALTTLAFDYPDPDKPERAAMFRGQLGDFLTLVMQGKLDLETRGSTPAPSACRSSCRAASCAMPSTATTAAIST